MIMMMMQYWGNDNNYDSDNGDGDNHRNNVSDNKSNYRNNDDNDIE